MRNTKGFTLIELLIYMALLSMLLIIITDLFVSGLGVKKDTESFFNIEQDGRYIIARLSYDIRQAKTVTIPATPTSMTLRVGTDNWVYSLVGGNLQLTNAQGTFNVNGSDVTIENLNFQRIGAVGDANKRTSTVRLSFTVRSKLTQSTGQETRNFATSVGMRCYASCN